MKKDKLVETVKNIEFMEDKFEDDWGDDETVPLLDEIEEIMEEGEEDLIAKSIPYKSLKKAEREESLVGYIKDWQDTRYAVEVQVLAKGKLPEKAHKEGDAGFDVFMPEDITVRPGQVKKIPLNFKMKFAPQSWASIESKSGLAAKGLQILGGVIDSSYRGVVSVVVTNLNWEDPSGISLKAGDKVAQIVMHPYTENYKIKKVKSIKADTERGIGGFNSTGNC